MEQSSRIEYSLGFFNYARGFAILIVIAGHSIALFLDRLPVTTVSLEFSGAGRVLGGGLMAMFFLISGFYFYHRTPKKCLRLQSKLLLIPYALTGATILLATILMRTLKGTRIFEESFRVFLTYLFGFNALRGETFFGFPIASIGVFWFLLALFNGWILYNLILWIKNRKLRILCIALCIILSWQLSLKQPLWPMAIPSSLMAVGYLAFGHQIRKFDLLGKKLSPFTWMLLVPVSVICLAFGYVDISYGIWQLGLIDVAGSFIFGFLFLRIYAKFMAFKATNRKTSPIEYLGLHSIRTLCLHALEKHLIPWKNLALFFPSRPVLCMLLCFVFRMFLIVTEILLINRMKSLIYKSKRRKIIITDI